MKICKRCKIEKSLDEYYKCSAMSSGYINFCRECKQKEAIANYDRRAADPDFSEKERERSREKYHRLHDNWKKSSPEQRRQYTNNYRQNYPEKNAAHNACRGLEKSSSKERHHWSYNKEHYLDIINLSIIDHNLIHRSIVYDQEFMMYRTISNELLDTKEKHLTYINEILSTKVEN